MPMAISFVGASIIWKFVYDYRDPSQPQIGLLSQVVIWLGWKNPPNWLLSHPLEQLPADGDHDLDRRPASPWSCSRPRSRRSPTTSSRPRGSTAPHGFGLFSRIQIPMIRSHAGRGAHHDHDRDAEDLRHRPDDDRRQLRHRGAGERDVLRTLRHSQHRPRARARRDPVPRRACRWSRYNVVQLRKERATR